MNEKFANVIRQRVYQRVPLKELTDAGITEFYVGGNSLNRNPPNDIDIFPISGFFPHQTAEKLGKVVSSTKNAITVKVNVDKTLHHQTVEGTNDIEVSGKTVTVQLCNYLHPSLEELVNSFDFSHIQVGAKVTPTNIDIYCTDKYEESKLCQSTEYFGSEYPISSLIRTFKYAKRGDFAGDSHIFSVLKILADISCRGFSNYEDFKNQLDAVDLGLVPENQDALTEAGLNFTEEGNSVLNKLYSALSISKKALAKDAELSLEYAKSLGERYFDGEAAIAKNGNLSLNYAMEVIKGRFEIGEEAISKDANCSIEYARNILKDRFELGEEAISKNTNALYTYHVVLGRIELPEDLHNIMLAHAMNNDYYANIYFSNIKRKVA